MNKVELYIFDTRKFTTEEIVDLLQLSESEIVPFNKFSSDEIKKEKLVSFFYKKVFANDYYVDEFGKPLSNNLFFNVSHSKGLVVKSDNN